MNDHPARKVIREALSKLSAELAVFEQTTRRVPGPFTIESVSSSLVECYNGPDPASISNLSQQIDGLRDRMAVTPEKRDD